MEGWSQERATIAGEIERDADAVVSGGERAPSDGRVDVSRASSEGTLDGVWSGALDGLGGAEGTQLREGGRCERSVGEERRTAANSLTRSGGCVTLAFRGYSVGHA